MFTKSLKLSLFLSFLMLMGQQACETTPSTSRGRDGGLFSGARNQTISEIPGDTGPNGQLNCDKPRSTFQCMMCNCWAEARGLPYDGMLAVSKVVMTRVGMSSFPNTVCGVVYQSSQFSWTNKPKTRNININVADSPGCYQSVKEGFKFRGQFASHYHTPGVWPDWRDDNNPTRFRMPGHIFYRRLRTEGPDLEAPENFDYRSTVRNLLNGESHEFVCQNN